MNDVHLKTLEEKITELLSGRERVIVGIDGFCAAGKTTLADRLSRKFDCNVFHMDDFFLRPGQRTPERLAEVGGNVDYERFHDEVIVPLLNNESFSYRPYDCHTMKLTEPVKVKPKALNIIEGTYSLHPYNATAFDLSVFVGVDEALQRERILKRPAQLHEKFFQLWIPMEHRYFEKLRSEHEFDLIIE